MRRAATFAASILLSATLVVTAQTPPPAEVAYNDNFQSYGTQANPPGWIDSSIGNPAPNAQGLYKTWPEPLEKKSANIVYGTKQSSGNPVGNNPRIGTFSTLSTKTFSAAGRFEYRGRFIRTNTDSRIGLTFFSSYPTVDRYYLIGLWNQPSGALTMQLFGFGAGTFTGTTDSNTQIAANKWYRFAIFVDELSGATHVRARFWLDGTTEPTTVQIDANDATAQRLRSGRIGMWAAVKGDAYIDDLFAKSPMESDTSAPVITILESGNAMPTNSKFNRNAVPEIRVTDDSTPTPQVTTTLDGAPFTSLTPVTMEGWHTLAVHAVDNANNASDLQVQFLVDKTPPVIAILEGTDPFPANFFFNRDVVANANVTDVSNTNLTATLDGQPYVLGNPIAGEGAHALTVTATDEVNWSATAGPIAFTIDKTAPVLTFTSPANNALLDAPRATILGGSDDAIAVIVNDTAAVIDANAHTFRTGELPLLEGTNTIIARGTDRAGNVGQATLTLLVDTRAPVLTITTPAANACIDAATLTVSGTIAEARLDSVKVNGVLATVNGGQWTASVPVEEKSVLLTVEAKDTTGKTATVSRTVTIDRTAPVIEVTSNAEPFTATVANRALTLHVRANDADPNVALTSTLDGNAYATGTTITGEGAHHVVIKATDCAGHTAEKTFDFTIDLTAPTLRELQPANGGTVGTMPNALSGKTDTDVASVTIDGTTLHATPAADGAFTIANVPFNEGTNRLTLVATDRAGNRGTVQYDLVVRTGAPVVEIVESGLPIVDGALYNRAVAPVARVANDTQATITATLNDQPFTSGTSITADGTYRINATATDTLGHHGTATASFTVDRTPPAVDITAPAADAIIQSDHVEVHGTVGDAIAATLNGIPLTIGSGGAFVLDLSLDYGANPIVVNVRDRAGNSGSDAITVTRDDSGAGILLTYPPDHSLTNRATTDVVGRLLTAGRATTVKIGTQSVAVDPTGAFRISGYALTEGENAITATATAANGLQTFATTHVTGDFTPPSLTILESNQPLTDGARFATQAVITLASQDAGGPVTTELTVDGTTINAPATITAAGGHSIVAVSRDRAGNQSRAERMLFIGAGGGSADCSLSDFDPANNAVVLANRTTLVGRSGGAIGVKVNGIAAIVADGAFSASVELPNEGPNVVTIQCTDANGAATGTPATLTLQRVTGDPSIAITTPAENFVSAQETIAVTGTVGAGVTSADVNGMPAVVSGGTFTVPAVHLSDGLNILTAHGRNAAGRTATASRRGVYEKDAPSITITSPTGSATTGTNRIDVSGTFANLDPASIVVTNVAGNQTKSADATRFSDTTGAFVAHDVPLVSGDQTLRVSGRDRLNREATATVTVRLSANAPTIAITSPANSSYFPGGSTTFTVTGTFAAAAGATVDVNGTAATLNGSNFTATATFSQTAITPIVARVTEPGGASATATAFVTQLADAPRVLETFPADAATEVDSGALLLVLFSQPMDVASLASGFRLEDASGNAVNGTLFLDKDVLTFAPATLLQGGGHYTLRVTTAAKNLAGTAIATAFASSFTVAASAPSTPPVINPIADAICGQSVTITGTASPNARVRLESGALVLTATADAQGKYTFTYPISGQSGFALVRVRIVGSDGSFSPAAEVTVRVDCSGPQVLNAAFDRATNRITVNFSEAVKASSAQGAFGVALTDGSSVSSTANVAQSVVTLTPSSDLTQKSFTLTVGTQLEDVTGNHLAAAYSQEFAFGGGAPESGNGSGFISGEVYDATTGRPLPNVTIDVDVASPTPVTTTTDARGRYLARLPEGAHTIAAARSGYTSVWREIIVPAGAGVIPIDIRLTKRGDAQTSTGAAMNVTHGGDTAVTRTAELTIPASALPSGAKVTLTAIGAQSLTGLLPLGWSSIASAEVLVEGGALSTATLTFVTPAGAVTSAAQNLAAVQYDSARDEWRVLASAINIASDGRASITINSGGAYALVYADKAPGLTTPPLPVAGDVLQGVPAAPADAPELSAHDFKLDPSIVLPTGRTVATLRIEGSGAATFPSGTAVQAYIDEDLRLADGSRLLDPPFATDLLLYRNLSGDLGIADFHLAPSAKAAQVVLEVGFDHIRILPYPGRLDRGTLIGSEGGRVPADDKIAVEIPTGAVPEPLRATATSLTASDLASIGSVAGFRVVGGFQLSLQRATQPAPQDFDGDGEIDPIPNVELFLAARATYSVDASQLPSPASQVVLAEVLDASAFGKIIRLAAPMMPVDASSGTAVKRFTTKSIDRSQLPVDGVIREGRYLVLAAEAPIAFATGTVHLLDAQGRLLSDARVTAAPLGVRDVTRANGIYNVAVPARPAAPFTLVPRHASTGDGATYTHTAQVDPDAILRVDLALVPQPPVLGSVVVLKGDPPSQGVLTEGAITRDVAITTNVRASFTPSIDPASITDNSITVEDALTGTRVPGKATADGSVGVVWTLTAGEHLEPNALYTIVVDDSIRGANGARIARAQSYSIATVTQVKNADIHRERIRITIPDDAGLSRIIGEPGALPAGWQAVAVRRVRDFVVRYQATAANDGSFSFTIGNGDERDRITLGDLIDLRVVNTNGALAGVYALTPFVTEDGHGFVAPVGMAVTFTTPEGISVNVPEGAFDVPTIVTVNPAQKADFLDIPRIEDENEFATSVNIDFEGFANKPLDVSVPVPAGFNTAGKDFLLAWKGDSVRGPRLAAVDILRVADGKFTTVADEASSSRRMKVLDMKTGTNRTLVGKDFRDYLLRLIRGGRYAVLDIKVPVGGSVGWAVMEGLQANYDLMWSIFWSYYDPYVYVFERPARVIPVLTNVPFTVQGIDRATGLTAFSRAYDPIPAGEPGDVVSIPSPQQNDGGPYPVFGGPFRVEVLDLDVEDLDVRTIRNFVVRLSNGSVSITPSDDPLDSETHVQVLNVKRGTQASGTATSGISIGGKIGERIVLLIEQHDADAGNPISVVFDEPIYLGPDLQHLDAIDEFLHQHLKLEQAPEPAFLQQPNYTDITAYARFVSDSGDRRITVELPGPLQREAVYRLTLKSTLADVTTNGAGLKLGQGTFDSNGVLTPVGGGFDLPLVFHVRKPQGEIGTFSAASEGIIRGMDLYGNVLFVAAMNGGLKAFDVSNPAALSGTAPQLSQTIGPPNTAFQTEAITIDRHGRIYTTADLNIVGVMRSYRVEDFINGTATAASGRSSSIINWKLGYSSMIGLPSNTILSDRPESIPFRVKVVSKDDVREFKNRQEFEAGTHASPGIAYPLDDLKTYTVSIPFDGAPYKYQRITIENATLDMRWSADAIEGGSAVLTNVLARSGDTLRLVKNKQTYAVVAHLGYGIGVYDANAMESNRHPSITAATKMREQLFLGNGIVGRECHLDPPLWAIGENYINTDVEARGDGSDLYVYANHPSKGVLDYRIHLPSESGLESNDSSCDQRGPTGLVFRSYPEGNEGPRIKALANAIRGAGGGAYMHTMNMARVHWSITAEENIKGQRGTFPGTAAQRDYLLVASMQYGVIVVETNADPPSARAFPLIDEHHIADVLWIPGGAAGVRVMPESNTAVVTDGNGRVVLVDLSRIDERWNADGTPTTGLFPTAAKAIAGHPTDPNEIGSDDPRIIWKSGPGLTSGSLPPVFDASTGIVYGVHMTSRIVKAVSAVDPTVRMRINLNGPQDAGGVVPLGVAPPKKVQDTINSLPACSPTVTVCKGNASVAAFRLEVGLPGGMPQSLFASSGELWMAIESERVAGAVTPQTPDGFPRAHLRRKRRDGSAENAGRAASNFKLRRMIPEALASSQKYQRGYNKFVSPWIVAIADPRASEQYDWNGATKQQKEEAGCFACERPEFLKGKTETDDVYELWTNGRYLAVRPEQSGINSNVFEGTQYEYLGQQKRMTNRFTTIMADSIRAPEVLVAAQMPPVAAGMIQDTLFLHSGEVQTSAIDLNSGGRAGFDVSFGRTYRSRTIGGTVFGQGWDSMILRRLRALPSGDVEYRDGAETWLFHTNANGSYDSPKGLFLRLARTQRGWKLIDQKWRITEFDDLGRILLEFDEYYSPSVEGSGNVVRYLYDETGRLSAVVDPVARTSRLTYWSDSAAGVGAYPGLVKNITDWRDRKIDYSYDASSGTLTKVELPDVTNTDGGRPTLKYEYTPGSGYNDLVELRGNLKSITEPHEAASGGGARVTFQYSAAAGLMRDRSIGQQWATGESATYSYASATEATTKDALGQERKYTLTAQPKDYRSDRAHPKTIVEQDVPVSSTPFGTLPATLTVGVPALSSQARTFSFEYNGDGVMSSANAQGVRNMTFDYKDVGPEGPGYVVNTTTITGTGDAVTEKYEYQSGENSGTYVQAVNRNNRRIVTGDAHRNNLNPKASASNVFADKECGPDGLTKKVTSSGGTSARHSGPFATNAADSTSVTYTHAPDTAPLHQRGLLTQIDRGAGVTTRIEYPSPQMKVITDERGITTTLERDTWQRTTHETVSGAGSTLDQTIKYDANGQVTEVARQQGGITVTTKFKYDPLGRMLEKSVDNVAGAGVATTKFTYDMAARSVTVTYPGGAVTTRTMDGLGRTSRLHTETGSSPLEMYFAYDLDDNLVYQSDLLTATAMAFDSNNRLIGRLYPDGTKALAKFDAWNNPTSYELFDRGGVKIGETTFEFTEAGDLQSATSAVDGSQSRQMTFTWDAGLRPTGMSVSGRAAESIYDSAGRLLSTAHGEGSNGTVTTPYEQTQVNGHDGRLPQSMTRSEKSGGAYSIAVQYNTSADVIAESFGNLEWGRAVDQAGNVTSMTMPNRGARTYDYDSRGAVTEETLPGGGSLQYGYDANMAMKSFTDPTSEATQIDTDKIGRPLRLHYKDGTEEVITWEGRRVKSVVSREGRARVFVYNERDEITQITDAGGTVLDDITYDGGGRITTWKTDDSLLEYLDFNFDGNPRKTVQSRFRNGALVDRYEQTHTWNEHGERTGFSMPTYTGFAPSTGPWTSTVTQTFDATSNVTSITRTMFGGTPSSLLLEATYRNAGRPDRRTITTIDNARLVRDYSYDPDNGLLTQLFVTSNGFAVAGSRIQYDGLQKSRAQILGVSGDARASEWSYDARSRLQNTILARDAGSTPQSETLTLSDFRLGLDRPAETPIDPPSLRFTENGIGGHKIDTVQRGGVIEQFTFVGGERRADGKYLYDYDRKGRMSMVTQKSLGTATSVRRVKYTYDGSDRLIGRTAEYAVLSTPGATPANSDWKLEDRANVLAADALPADTTFVWDPVDDHLAAIYKAGASQMPSIDPSGGLIRQILHGGVAYDDPIEVSAVNGASVAHLYPVFDEAGAGALQIILNEHGEIVSRSASGGPYGEDEAILQGSAVDLSTIDVAKNDQGQLTSVAIKMRTTEAIDEQTLAAGTRLASVSASGAVARTSSVVATLADPSTLLWTLTPAEWQTLTDTTPVSANGTTITPVALSVGITSALRAKSWSASAPTLPAPAWAVASKPVFTSPSMPVEVRESLASVTALASSGGHLNLYQIPTLTSLGNARATSAVADAERLIVASGFHAHPFQEPLTSQNYVRARWYDVQHGVWLTPDPMGYIDSPNLYAYAGGDPVNGRDATGQYEADFHYGLTMYLALQAGFTPAQAKYVAEGTEAPDLPNQERNPIEAGKAGVLGDEGARQRLREWHFPKAEVESGEVEPCSIWAREKIDAALKNGSLKDFAEGLHPFQDSWSHRGLPSLGGYGGHPEDRGGGASHDTDLTYKYPDKAMEAAEATYTYLVAFALQHPEAASGDPNVMPQAPQPWASFASDVQTFVNLSTKTDKRQWLESRGVEMSDELMNDTSLWNGDTTTASEVASRAKDAVVNPAAVGLGQKVNTLSNAKRGAQRWWRDSAKPTIKKVWEWRPW